MKYILIAMAILALAAGIASAEKSNFTPKDRFCVIEKKPVATEPVGAVIETAGVFVGRIVSACEIAMTGERKITVENETGECKIFPFCKAAKIADDTFHTATFNQLKSGKKVKVEYTEESGIEKAKSVTVAE